MSDRLKKIENILMDNTVLDDWFSPIRAAFEMVRFSAKKFHTLSMPTFVLQNCLRQLNSNETLREHIQTLFHLNEEAKCVPLARSTYSDALSSQARFPKIEIKKHT